MGRGADHARPRRVKVFSNTAISLDGRINTRERGFTSFGTRRDHAQMSRLRARADAVLVGGATFRNWPHPAVPDAADAAADGGRNGKGRAEPIWNVVVSRSLDLPLTPDFLDEAAIRPLFLTRAASLDHGFTAEAEGWRGEGDDIPVAWMLAQLERRGVQRLLVEAGGDLLFQFLAAGAIDEMFVTLCPLVAGGPAPGLADGAGFDFDGMPRLRLRSAEAIGDEVFLHYAVVR